MTPLYTQPQELTWGSLVLDAPVDPDLPWRIDTLAESASLGNPQPLVEVIESGALTDGSLAVVTAYDNREVTFRVCVSAPDGIALAQAEAAFTAAVRAARPAPLVWIPPSGDAWPCVFEVVTVRCDGDYAEGWDLEEKMRAQLFYTLTFECLPWTRRDEKTIIPAIAAPVDPEDPADPILIDACTSIANWQRIVTPTTAWMSLTGPTASGGAVGATGTLRSGTGEAWLMLERTSAVSMTGTPYLVLDVERSAFKTTSDLSIRLDPDTFTERVIFPTAIIPTGTAGVYSYYFEANGDFTKMRVRQRVDRDGTGHPVTLRLHNVARIASIPSPDAAGYQLSRTAVIGGTVPTQAALRLTTFDGEHDTDEVMSSSVLVYTGENPAVSLRTFLDTGAATSPDVGAITGESLNLSVPSVFLVPVAQVIEANYALFARLKNTGNAVINWSARVVSSAGLIIPGSDVVESGSMLITGTGLWEIHELGSLPLPVLSDLDEDSTHCVELTVSMTTGGAAVNFDEGWLLDDDNGATTVLNGSGWEIGGTGVTGPHTIELRSPQLDSPHLKVIGTWADFGSQDITRLASRIGTHLLTPGLMHALTVADGIKYALLDLEYYERFHTRPGPPYVAPTAA